MCSLESCHKVTKFDPCQHGLVQWVRKLHFPLQGLIPVNVTAIAFLWKHKLSLLSIWHQKFNNTKCCLYFDMWAIYRWQYYVRSTLIVIFNSCTKYAYELINCILHLHIDNEIDNSSCIAQDLSSAQLWKLFSNVPDHTRLFSYTFQEPPRKPIGWNYQLISTKATKVDICNVFSLQCCTPALWMHACCVYCHLTGSRCTKKITMITMSSLVNLWKLITYFWRWDLFSFFFGSLY